MRDFLKGMQQIFLSDSRSVIYCPSWEDVRIWQESMGNHLNIPVFWNWRKKSCFERALTKHRQSHFGIDVFAKHELCLVQMPLNWPEEHLEGERCVVRESCIPYPTPTTKDPMQNYSCKQNEHKLLCHWYPWKCCLADDLELLARDRVEVV